VAGHGALGVIGDADALGIITRLHIPTRQDFLNNLVLVRRAELVLKLLSARRIQYALLAVSRNQNLPPSNNIAQCNTGVSLPFLQLLLALNENSKLLAAAALVKDLGLLGIAAGHGCCLLLGVSYVGVKKIVGDLLLSCVLTVCLLGGGKLGEAGEGLIELAS